MIPANVMFSAFVLAWCVFGVHVAIRENRTVSGAINGCCVGINLMVVLEGLLR